MHPSEFEAMMAAEEHWWYRSRRTIVDAALDGLELPPSARILDVGCGSGRMLDELAHRGAVTGIDIRPEAIAATRARGHADAYVGRAEQSGLASDDYDLVTAFDVVEHTADDRQTLAELLRVTRPDGALLVTVPAYQALWSHHDVVNEHYRRYTSRSLAASATVAGWRVAHSTYFFSYLLGPAAAMRKLERLRSRDAHDLGSDLDYLPSRSLLARMLEAPSLAEAAIIRAGRRIPAGLSLLMILRPLAATATRLEPRTESPAPSPRHGRSSGFRAQMPA